MKKFHALCRGPWGTVLVIFLLVPALLHASSMAVATGNATVDGRPVLWKNRDHWSTWDGWKVHTFNYTADDSSFGAGDQYHSRFNYLGITAEGDSGVDRGANPTDPADDTILPWAGANDRGLIVVQVAAHTLTSGFANFWGYDVSQDLENGMSGGYFNHVVLSRCEHIDEVEQVLRDTNNGGGFRGSFARNTSTMIAVADRWGNAAIFEIDGNSFARDNVTAIYHRNLNNDYTAPHEPDQDLNNPADGNYHGYDWRSNFSKIRYWNHNSTIPFPYFVDNDSDGIHDRESASSSEQRYNRVGFRMDDPYQPNDWPLREPFLKNYRHFIQRYVGYQEGPNSEDRALPLDADMETVSRSIGNLPYTDGNGSHQKPTGLHVSRFVSTFGAVFTGSKIGDPYEGKLAVGWICLGEPSVGLFVPVFPYAAELPAAISDMYAAINTKRHLVYDYASDHAGSDNNNEGEDESEDIDGDGDEDSDGYVNGRNVDHSIDTVALAGAYYGDGGIQGYTFAIENWAFDQLDGFMASLRGGTRTEAQLRTDLRHWQTNVINAMKSFYQQSRWPNSFEAESWANTLTGHVVRATDGNMSWGGKVTNIGGGLGHELIFEKIRTRLQGTHRVLIHYSAGGPRTLYLSVNGAASTRLDFPSTGGPNTPGTKVVLIPFQSGNNSLRFYNTYASPISSQTTPDLDRIVIASDPYADPTDAIDNTSPGFSITGDWVGKTTLPGYWGSDYLTDPHHGGDSTRTAKWTPDIAAEGDYTIYMRWVAGANQPDAAPLEIKHAQGLDTSKKINQQLDGSQWVEIGTYTLKAGTSNYVLLRCTDTGEAIADAVWFVKQP